MNEVWKVRILTFFRYFGDSLFYPFFSLFLQHLGLLESKIGFILSISPLIGILTNPIYTKICKNYNSTRFVLGVISIVEAIMIGILPLFSNFYLISIITLIMAIFGTCHYGLMDSLLTIISANKKVNYSSIRLFGSSAYIIGTSIGGIIINIFSFNYCFILSCILFIISGILYHLLKPINHESKVVEKVKIKDLFKNKEFVLFLLLYTFLMGTTNAGDYFFSVYLNTRGITSSEYGMIYSYYVIVEVVLLFIFTKKADKINNNKLLILASFLLGCRMLINGMYASLPVVIVSSGLRGVTYAILLHVSFQTVLKIVKEQYATTGIMLITLGQSIFVLIFNNVNGHLIEKTNTYKYYYLLMFIFSIIALFLAIIRYYQVDIKNKKLLK